MRLQTNIVGHSEQQLYQPAFDLLAGSYTSADEIQERSSEKPAVDNAIDLRIDQGVKEDGGTS